MPMSMDEIKKKIEKIEVYKGDTFSVLHNGVELLDYKHKGPEMEINWVAIFEYNGAVCGGFFKDEPK